MSIEINPIMNLEDIDKAFETLEKAHAYNMFLGDFYVDGMSNVASGIYYTVDVEEGYEENFISFDGLVDAWHIVPNPENPNEFGWGFTDQR